MITVLQPDPKVILDRFGTWFTEAGADFQVIELFRQQVPSLSECGDGIVVLGGTMDALDREAAPWLDDVHALLREARAAEMPVLGICLGHQIIADCFGGEVTVAAQGRGEHGARTVTLSDEGKADPLLSELDGESVFAEQHFDAVTQLPDGAIPLASSEACAIQAFRLGTVVGLQFHPEASPQLMEFWSSLDGGEPGIVEREMLAVDNEVAANGRAIAHAFVAGL